MCFHPRTNQLNLRGDPNQRSIYWRSGLLAIVPIPAEPGWLYGLGDAGYFLRRPSDASLSLALRLQELLAIAVPGFWPAKMEFTIGDGKNRQKRFIFNFLRTLGEIFTSWFQILLFFSVTFWGQKNQKPSLNQAIPNLRGNKSWIDYLNNHISKFYKTHSVLCP